MKKILTLLLALSLLLLSGCSGQTVAEQEEPSPEPFQMSEEEKQESLDRECFAIAASYCFSGLGLNPEDPMFLWDCCGWYAALVNRIDGSRLISEDTIIALQKSLGGEYKVPNDAERAYYLVDMYTAEGGASYYLFDWFFARLDELLGIRYEYFIEEKEDAIFFTMRFHGESGETYDTFLLMSFTEDNENMLFPRTLDYLVEYAPEVEMDPALTFDEELLLEANSMRNILNIYPALHIYVGDSFDIWYFLVNGKPVHLTEYSDGSAYGFVDGLWFSHENGHTWIRDQENIDPWEESEFALTYLFDGAASMSLEEMGEETIAFRVDYRNGQYGHFVVNKGTLVLESASIVMDMDADFAYETRCEYEKSDELTPWIEELEGKLRTVTVVQETFDGAEPEINTYVLRIPVTWEFLPYEADGDEYDTYTVWMDSDYTIPYAYPGDNLDYTLYFTTAKG